MSTKYFDLILPALCANPALASLYPEHLVRQAWQIAAATEKWLEQHQKEEGLEAHELTTTP